METLFYVIGALALLPLALFGLAMVFVIFWVAACVLLVSVLDLYEAVTRSNRP